MPSSHRVVSHEEVQNLLEHAEAGQAWSYIDVRTPIEFASGHIEGAFNVPFKHGSIEGLKHNPDFITTMLQAFPPTQNLIVGCHSGGRAKAACVQLASLGYTTLALHADSLAGSRDHFGRLSVGWLAQGLPVTISVEPGHSYAELTALR